MQDGQLNSQSEWTAVDLEFMGQALNMARTASGRTAPNPAVGALVVKNNEILGRGATQPPPGRHAEIGALREAGEAARGSNLYVTLEPCSHHGRTPPCVDAIITAGISRVVVGMFDPHPRVNGSGVERLCRAGLEVAIGCREDEALEQIAGFQTRITCGRPRTTAKYAMTLDGRIATVTGHSRWISGPESRQYVHQLRDRSDAILAGLGTALADDPQLTTRLPAELTGYGGPHHPLRVILDSKLRLPASARMLASDTPGATLIYTTHEAPDSAERGLREVGAAVVRVAERRGRVDLEAVLADLSKRGINDLLIEGGSSVLGSFFNLGLIDRASIFVAPKIVGGACAPGPVGGCGVNMMSAAWELVKQRVTQFGDDVLIEGEIARGSKAEHV